MPRQSLLAAASLIAFLCGEFVNSLVLAKMKILTGGRRLWMRTIGSTVVGELVGGALQRGACVGERDGGIMLSLARAEEEKDWLDAERLRQEVALLLDRADVTEEGDRLTCHLGHLRDAIAGDGPAGRPPAARRGGSRLAENSSLRLPSQLERWP